MRIIYADKELISEVLLHAMRGFYLLQAPISKPLGIFHNTFIIDKAVILIAESAGLVIRINKQVIAILKSQQKLAEKNKNTVLGILTKPNTQTADLNDVSFTVYMSITELNRYLTKKQIANVTKKLGELNYD